MNEAKKITTRTPMQNRLNNAMLDIFHTIQYLANLTGCEKLKTTAGILKNGKELLVGLESRKRKVLNIKKELTNNQYELTEEQSSNLKWLIRYFEKSYFFHSKKQITDEANAAALLAQMRIIIRIVMPKNGANIINF